MPTDSTRVSQFVSAPRAAVYAACLDPNLLVRWRVPESMTGQVHHFEAREGGTYRMSLTYVDAEHPAEGKTTEHTDTFEGRFARLVPNQKIVETVRFQSPDPQFAGEMTLTTTFTDAGAGTEVTILCENLPEGVRSEDNELGTRQALKKLEALFT